MIFESLPIQFAIRSGLEVFEAIGGLVVNEDNSDGSVVTGLHPTIQRQTVNPSCQIGCRNPAPKHPLEVHNKVEGHAVDIIGINHNDILTPKGLVLFLGHLCFSLYACKNTK